MTIINKATVIAISGITLMLSACTTLYKPNPIHSPMLTNKGEGHISTTLGISGTGLASMQAAYAVSDHIGIMTDGMFHYRETNYTDPYNSGQEILKIFSGEVGIGYFEKFGVNQKQLFQIYTGGGYGTTKAKITYINEPNPVISANFYNMYIQPGVVFTGNYMDLGIDVRMNYVNLFNVNAYLYDSFDFWNTNYNFTSDSTLQFVLLEPNFTMKVGSKHLKGIFQAGLTIPIVNADGYFATNSDVFYFAPVFKLNIGVSYVFGRK